MMISYVTLYDDEMSWGHGDGYVVLQAPMDGPVIEIVYEETMIHSTEAVLGDVSSRKVVRMSSWYITHGRHTRVNTSVGTIYCIFWFSWYKIYIYYVLKSIFIIKRTLVVSDFVLARRCLEKVFDCLRVLNERYLHRRRLVSL